MILSGRLVLVCESKNSAFIPGFAYNLQTQWKSICIKTTQNAYGWQTIIIGKRRIFWRERLRIGACIADCWNGGCGSWQQQNVNVLESLAGNCLSIGFDVS